MGRARHMRDLGLAPESQNGRRDYAKELNPTGATDLGNARRLVAAHGEDLRWCEAWGRWLAWTGKRWEADETGEVYRRAKKTVAGIYAEAAEASDDGTRKALATHAMRSESRQRIEAMIELAKSEPGIPVKPEQLDADPYLFNCANGTLDLKTGKLRDHDRLDLVTKMSPVEYDAEARSELFERVLREATEDKEDLAAFLRRWAGYCLTGDTGEEKIAFAHGPAATAKSTVIEALKAAWGDYAATADFEAFLARRDSGGPRNDIARLAGKRLVVSIEVDEGKRLAEGLIKMITGGDTVTARFLYREAFEFVPQFKLTLAANHAPHVRDDDEAMWRRILRVPFENVIPKGERDPEVKRTLRDPKASGPAILAWAVRGCMEWQREGLGVPKVVEEATEGYREDMDPLKDFLEAYCVVGPGVWCYAGELREAYETWARESGEHRLIKGREWGERLRTHGGVADKTTGGRRIWRGIALVSEPDGDGGGKVADSATEQNPSKPQESGRTAADSGSKIGNSASKSPREADLPKAPPLSATPPLGSAGEAPRRLTEEEAERVKRLIAQGMKPEIARREVLGKGA
ncbi:MAG: phage/plasmid primase, P4 family [Actinomycetota bacterium]|nr:phage/plasmid primase, P4 family [Actinomycetota bacterium]